MTIVENQLQAMKAISLDQQLMESNGNHWKLLKMNGHDKIHWIIHWNQSKSMKNNETI